MTSHTNGGARRRPGARSLVVWLALLSSAPAVPARSAVEPTPLRAECEESTDDTRRIQALIDAAAAARGGRVVIAGGRACLLDGPAGLDLKANVELFCEPGSVIKAGASFRGPWLVTKVLSSGNQGVRGCTFDLNGKGVGAARVGGTSAWLTDNRAQNGPTTASAFSMFAIIADDLSSGALEARGNFCACANSIAAHDSCLEVSGPVTANSVGVIVEGNHATQCSGNGIDGGRGAYRVVGNFIEVIGPSSIAIDLASQESSAVRNKVILSGASATGIRVGGSHVHVSDSFCRASGDGGICYLVQAGAAHTTWTGNSHDLRGLSAIGYDAHSAFTVISAAQGVASGSPASQTHVRWGDRGGMAKHLVVAGGSFKGGAIGVAPTDVATDRKGAINAAITGVEFFGQSYASIIATTGVVVTGGRATWLGPRAVCIMLGDDRAVGGGASHASITGFTCHCSRCSTLIKAYVDGRRCSKGAEKEFQTCTSDADCGGTSGSCTYDGVDGVSITGNTLLGGRPRHISTAIDLGSEFDADSGSVSDVVLSGNVIQLLGGTRRCFSFPGATFVEKASNIEIGINADASCTTRAYQWQDSMGRDWEAPKMAIRE